MRALFAIVAFTLAAPAAAEEMALAKGAELRILDKLTGQMTDADLPVGQSVTVGKLTVQMNECRYPASNQTADAEAHLTISDTAVSAPVFATDQQTPCKIRSRLRISQCKPKPIRAFPA